jgi:PAS domain S-box-containing protein
MTSAIRILHLEDSPRDAELIAGELSAGGLPCEVVLVDSKQRFESALNGTAFDLVLVDYNLAGYNGRAAFELSRHTQPNVPVIFVSGTLGEEAAIECLHMGATDYVLKQRLARLNPAVRRALAESTERANRARAEADLRESEAQLLRAQAVAQLGSWTFDVDSGQFNCSAETYRIYGLAPGTPLFIGDFLACVDPRDQQYLDRIWNAAVRGERPYDLVYRILVNGSEKSVHERGEMIHDDSGRLVRIVGMVQDVTEREKDRNALVESEHFVRATLSALADPIIVLDGTGHIRKTNKAWREFVGPSRQSSAHIEEGVDYLAVCDRAAADGVKEAATSAALIRELISGSRAEGGFEYAAPSAGHGQRWFLCRGSRFQSEEKTRVVIAHTDITARMLAEAALRKLNVDLEATVISRTAELEFAYVALTRKEEEIRSIVDNLASGIVSIDDKGIIHSANPAVERLLGFSAADTIGRNVSMFMPEPQGSLHDTFVERYRGSGQPSSNGAGREVEWLRKDGTRIPLDLTVSEYFVGKDRFFTGILRDDRERSRILNDLKQARDRADQASGAKSEFLAAMSHEIRTPMNGVIGMLDVLHQTSLKGPQVEMVELIRESAYSLLSIINDILDHSKIEAGRLDIERIPLRIEQVVERVCVILDPMAEKAGVELALFVDPAIPAEVLGDPGRFRQVLVNLINNAIKFSIGQSRRARVTVRAVLAGLDTQQITLEIRVSDTGIGMDAATVSRLFRPFTQADASTTRLFGGTGLGLAIAHDLLQLMGGQIAVQSALGEGSCFALQVPFARVPYEKHAAPPMSVVAGLVCVVVGAPEGLGDDLAVYLRHADATVFRESNLERARQHASGIASGPSVWVIDTGDECPSAEELRSKARIPPQADARIVMVAVERGKRRIPRRIAPDVIMVDGNVLRRETFLTAVAAAAGRVALEPARGEEKQDPTQRVVPSRDEALRKGCLILVVEDNQTNQKVILAQLRAFGLTADVVGNGREALERWASTSYGLLLTDLHMPQMDGYELTTAIRTRESGAQHVPIVALTANALQGEADRCRELGMDDYLSKPVSLADLKATLDKWLPSASLGVRLNETTDRAAAWPAAVAMPADINVLKALVGGDEATMRKLMRDFTASTDGVAAAMRAACAGGQPAAARAAAHNLKSSARAIGALVLSELCVDMERAGGAGDMEMLATKLPLFENEISRVNAYLYSILGAGGRQ